MAPDGSAFPLRTALRDERAAALDHGFELLREAWQSFDAPRAMQPSSVLLPTPEPANSPTR